MLLISDLGTYAGTAFATTTVIGLPRGQGGRKKEVLEKIPGETSLLGPLGVPFPDPQPKEGIFAPGVPVPGLRLSHMLNQKQNKQDSHHELASRSFISQLAFTFQNL